MFDVHCHMLPGIDDGSKNTDMSLEMIRRSVDQGINGIVFTPHFYADMNSPETFLKNREASLEHLKSRFCELDQVPAYCTGAEVHFFRGMSRFPGLESLCIGKSNFILIEMPFRDWQSAFIDEIEEISKVVGLNVIIAHIERYFDQDKRLVNRLLDNPDFLIQCNAEFFIEKHSNRKAMKFLKSGRIDLLASDSHNLESRRPNIGEAVEIIRKKDKYGALDHFHNTGKMIFNAAL